MKTKIEIACFLILLLALPTQSAEIPGGIVFSSGRNVIYYDFETGQKTNLLPDLSPGSLKAAAISPDGKVLVWLTRGKFWAKALPDGKPFALPTKKNADRSLRRRGVIDVLEDIPEVVKGTVENLSVSTDKYFISYQIRGKVREQKREIDHAALRRKMAETSRRYRRRRPTGRVRFSTPMKPAKLFDRTVSFVIPIKPEIRVERARRALSPEFFGKPGYSIAGSHVGRADACFPTWSKNGETVAFIFHDSGRWGPIVTFDVFKPDEARGRWIWESEQDYQERKAKHKRTYKEKRITLASCEGLAWRPDGTITVMSKGTLYSEDGRVITRGIKGNNLCWITNKSFIFRGIDKALYSWEEGKGKKLLDSVPEEFSYCCRSPLADENIAAANKEAEGENKAKPGIDFRIGAIKTGLEKRNRESIYLRIVVPELDPWGIPQGQKQLKFALTDETRIEDIKDPTQYDYKTFQPKKNQGRNRATCLAVSLNKIILLREGSRYAAIKPTELQQLIHKGKPVYLGSSIRITARGKAAAEHAKKIRLAEAVERLRQRNLSPQWEWIVYEWKYWPETHLAAKDGFAAVPFK